MFDGEAVFRVPSLDIDGEAVALFVGRARSARPDLQLDDRSQATLAEICRRLDGIPLAIELAATQVVHLSLTEILGRLNDRFRLLVGGRRRIPRQQTLTAALDWSYDLLSRDEQLLFRRLAVFRGTFSLPAAEAICHPQALELLRSLVVKSLVSLIDHGENVRYRLLESVRIYADGKLVETGESEQLRSAHRDFYLELIESLPAREGQTGNVIQVAAEADNLTAALEWCRQQGHFDLCARIAGRMTLYWSVFVRVNEMMAWWRDLDAGLPAEDRDHRAMAFLLRAYAAMAAGDGDQVEACSAKASAFAGAHHWVNVLAQFLQALSWSEIDPRRAERHLDRAMEIEASLGLSPDPLTYVLLYCLRFLQANSREESFALLDDWLADLGDSTPPPHMVGVFALYGDTGRALELKARYPKTRTPVGRLYAVWSDALVASALGHFDDAEQHLATLAALMGALGVRRWEAVCLLGFAKVALDRGDHARASRLLAAVDSSRPFRNPIITLVYVDCARLLQDVLDPDSLRVAQAEGSGLALKEALDAELIRTTTTAMRNPAR